VRAHGEAPVRAPWSGARKRAVAPAVILAIDIGNTSISLAAFDGDRLVADDRLPVDDAEWISHTWRSSRLARAGAIEAVLLSSVRPAAEPPIVAWASVDLRTPLQRPRIDFPIPLGAKVASPDEVGVDRLLASYAAHRRARGAAIAITFGTAITVNAVSASGDFLGGAIGPGVGLSAEALSRETAFLPRVEPVAQERVIGTDTPSAIRSALYHGFGGMVAHLVAGVSAEMGGSPAVFGTGGDAVLLSPHLPGMVVVPHLVAEGLVRAWLASQGRPLK